MTDFDGEDLCEKCYSRRPMSELNIEAKLHHGAQSTECIDRKSCDRRRRKRGIPCNPAERNQLLKRFKAIARNLK